MSEKQFVYMRSFEPNKKEPRLELDEGTFWLDDVYDKDKQIAFRVMQEPPWIHMEPMITYEIVFSSPNDRDGYQYRLWRRLTDNIVIVAEYYNDRFITADENLLGPGWKKMPIADYQFNQDIKISERVVGEAVRESLISDEYW